MTTEPGTPQTAYGRSLDDEIGDTVVAGGSVREYILAIEAEARAAAEDTLDDHERVRISNLSYAKGRAARDAEVRALPVYKSNGKQYLNRRAVLAILDADTPS